MKRLFCFFLFCVSLGVYAQNLSSLRAKAEGGDAEAQYTLGTLYYRGGNGVVINYNEAFNWFYKSASRYNPKAQRYLGVCYEFGYGVSKNDIRAEECYIKAVPGLKSLAENGDAEAQFGLGVCYSTGNGVQQSYSDAVKWYRMAAEQGNSAAQSNLGACYMNGNGVQQSYGNGN